MEHQLVQDIFSSRRTGVVIFSSLKGSFVSYLSFDSETMATALLFKERS